MTGHLSYRPQVKNLACERCGYTNEATAFPIANEAWHCPHCCADESSLLPAWVVALEADNALDAASIALAEAMQDFPSAPPDETVRTIAVAARGDRYEVWINTPPAPDAEQFDLEAIINY